MMAKSKIDRLKESGTLNPHPESVTDALFSDGAFFDRNDLLQVRYEMIRSHTKSVTLKEIAKRYGMSVPTCVRLKRDYREGGMQALIPSRPGPRGPRKITPEMLEFAKTHLKQHANTSIRCLAELVSEKFKVNIHFSGLHRALSKKNS